ncbi:hypothetical protein HGD85_03835, partial [Rhodobacteraceae bacterium R_SAG10]|nr:hypothetical protein [Rhodobacteraceae bacterium R_SAG10]
LITIQSQLVFVEAGGETIELALIYSIINDELGVLLTGEEEVTDDGVVISRLYTDGEWVTDLSYDEFC